MLVGKELDAGNVGQCDFARLEAQCGWRYGEKFRAKSWLFNNSAPAWMVDDASGGRVVQFEDAARRFVF